MSIVGIETGQAATELAKQPPQQERPASVAHGRGLAEILQRHKDWLDSNGDAGERADLSGALLENADLTDARLQDAVLNKAVLKGADLLLADLRGASLLQANLEGANLLGARLQETDLQAACLDGATSAVGSQFAGANLFEASMPNPASIFEGLKQVREFARRVGWLLAAMLLLNGLIWFRIITTTDPQLLQNAPALPFPGFQRVSPLIPFHLIGPVLLLALYACFHLYLQRLWEGLVALPAILPDGRRVDTCVPWFARWPARFQFKWLESTKSPLASLEKGIAMLLLYWVVPATMLLFWSRYLTMEDLRGTSLHILLIVGAIVAATFFPDMVDRAFDVYLNRSGNANNPSFRKVRLQRTAVPLGIGALLFLLSAGTILGAPHDSGRTGESGGSFARTWAADLLWLVGYSPYARLTDANVSLKPPSWSGQEAELSRVLGANLSRLNLRYAQAYGAFFVRARLWQADLRNASLSEADLREANLRQADLRAAVLDRARLERASLQDADLRDAVLNRANLREANLSSARASGASLLDATLDGAGLYKADLENSNLQRASLADADLREANLENANLSQANLREAYLSSAKLGGARLKEAQLSQAILDNASLRNADLSGAVAGGAILRGADLSGANLQGADLRGALGLTAAQTCAAANLAQAQLDDNLRLEMQTVCGSKLSPPSL
jgi:uncharacterized protein YjbI with pentapeptide repeats